MALYDDVVDVTKQYMGPAAQKFIDRQLTRHLNIEISALDASFLDELAKYCYSSGKLLMDDGKAQELSKKVKSLK